jgi:hypothetical protein
VGRDAEHEQRLAGLRAWLDGIHRQDMSACAGVQRGVASSRAGRGHLSHLEKAIQQFNRFVLERVSADARGA